MTIDLVELNLPPIEPQLSKAGDDVFIFDSIRRKDILLTNEEWVRQHVIAFLINQCGYPKGLISVEKGLLVNTLAKRSDILVYSTTGTPWLLVECKSFECVLTEDTIYQALNYHLTLKVKYIVITNGMEHYCLKVNDQAFEYIDSVPPHE